MNNNMDFNPNTNQNGFNNFNPNQFMNVNQNSFGFSQGNQMGFFNQNQIVTNNVRPKFIHWDYIEKEYNSKMETDGLENPIFKIVNEFVSEEQYVRNMLKITGNGSQLNKLDQIITYFKQGYGCKVEYGYKKTSGNYYDGEVGKLIDEIDEINNAYYQKITGNPLSWTNQTNREDAKK